MIYIIYMFTVKAVIIIKYIYTYVCTYVVYVHTWSTWCTCITCCDQQVIHVHQVLLEIEDKWVCTYECAFILSRLDYSNALLARLPYATIAPLQCVVNAAVRLVYGL